MKKFIITVDTEGDNLWNWKIGNTLTTNNSKYIPRFQELCEKYDFKPTYLTNYEMALDDYWVIYGSQKAKLDLCEIGMHIHAWNSPPDYYLEDIYHGHAYITEYPDDIIEQKVLFLVNYLSERFDTEIVSSRSGRWATNEQYFRALVKAGIKVDCSVTPEIDLSKIPGCKYNIGNNYSKSPQIPYEIYPGLLEIPMTTRHLRWKSHGKIKHRIKSLIWGEDMWLRPYKKSSEYLSTLAKRIEKERGDYLEFMIHSSELMLGGSPYYKNKLEIELLYDIMDDFFSEMKSKGYEGCTLKEYYLNR